MRIGFVGTGRLGAHLAGNLLRAGHRLTVHDLDRGSAAPLEAAGAAWAGSPSTLARNVDVVVTCLPDPAAVSSVLAGDDGILTTLRRDGVWIDTSTNDRQEVLRLAGLAAERGIGALEAPVTGGVHLAARGELTVIVGGDDDLVRRYRPLLEAFGRRVFHVGPLGRASDLKVITNMLAFVHLVACGEALVLAKQAGLDLAQSYEVIAASSGTSFVHETEGQVILNGSYDIGFTVDLALKDLGLALRLGRDTGVPLALASLVEAEFERAREVYGGDAWSPEVVRLLEDAVGIELRAPGFPATLA
jgi:3-hydroxyisobutyrate dehydrogenase